MSLGSRIASRVSKAIRNSPSPTPREPLLFLYPQWARSSSTKPPVTDKNPRKCTAKNESTKYLSSKHHALVDIPKGPSPLLNDPSDDPSNTIEPAFPTTEEHVPSPEFSAPPQIRSKGIFELEDDDIENEDQPAVHLAVELPEASVPFKSKERTPEETLAARARKIQTALERVQEYKEYQIKKRQQYQRRKTGRVADWREVLKILKEHTPQHTKWLDKAVHVKIPEDAVDRLVRSIDDYIVDIGERYDCKVDFNRVERPDRSPQDFDLSGSPAALSKTLGDVLLIAPETEVKINPSAALPAASNTPSESPLPDDRLPIKDSYHQKLGRRLPRFVVDLKGKSSSTANANDINTLTPASFLNAVENLITEHPYKHTEVVGVKTNLHSGYTKIQQQLLDLLLNKDYDHVITRTACHKAMEYFVKINSLLDLRTLFVRMDLLNVKLVPETFTIMLRAAARNQDLHTFQFVLGMMLKRQIAPNGETWLAFVKCQANVSIKIQILAAMKAQGLLLHLQTLRAACRELVVPELAISLAENNDLNGFISHMDSGYSPFWLSADNASMMLDYLGARGLISYCWKLIDIMDSRFVKASQTNIDTILHHCEVQRNLHGAIQTVENLPVDNHYRENERTYIHFFNLAWGKKYYNTAKVAWRYACLARATSYPMRPRIIKSVKVALHVENPETLNTQRWNAFAGRVVLGDNTPGNHPMEIVERPISPTRLSDAAKDLDDSEQSIQDPPPITPVDTKDGSESAKSLKASFKIPSVVQVTPLQLSDNSPRQERSEAPSEVIEHTTPTEPEETAPVSVKSELVETLQYNSALLDALRATQALDPTLKIPDPSLDSPELVLPTPPVRVPKKPLEPANRSLLENYLAIMRLDYIVGREWKPVKPFQQILREAYEKDIRWGERRLDREKDLEWLIGNSTSVPLERLKGMKLEKIMWK